MASAWRQRGGFHNLKPLENNSELAHNNGTYYMESVPEKKRKSCPNLCTMVWIFLVFCIVFLSGGFLGYNFREAFRDDEDGRSDSSTSGDTTDFTGQKVNQLWLDPRTLLSVHENIMYDITGDSIARNLRHLSTSVNTVSGSDWDKSSALKVKAILEKLMFDHVELQEHKVVLSFPNIDKPNRLQILNSTGHVTKDWPLIGQNRGSLNIPPSSNSSSQDEESSAPYLPPYVAFSGKGTIKGELVYCHYGRMQDIFHLRQQNIHLTNAIFLMRLGRISLEEKISNVLEVGGQGVLLYWDPDDLHLAPSNLEDIPYASLEHTQKTDKLLVQTISMEIAESLFKTLQGVEAPVSWQGGINLTYYLGRAELSPPGELFQLTVNTESKVKTIYNVIATVQGYQEPDRYVYIGAPRTSFSDSSEETKLSTAMLLSIAQALHDSLELRAIHWVPRRTIKLASWGGAEFSDLGMKLYMKERDEVFKMKTVAYLDLTEAVTGNETLTVAALPHFLNLVQQATLKVQSPVNSEKSLYKVWSDSSGLSPPDLSIFPTDTDSYPMLDTLGVAVIHYQYTCNHDNPQAKSNHLHPDFEELAMLQSQDNVHHFRFHLAIARVTTVTMLTLIDANFYAQLNMSEYGSYIFNRVSSLVETFNEEQDEAISLPVNVLKETALRFLRSSQSFEIFTPSFFSSQDELLVRRLNDHFILLDRSALFQNPYNKRRFHMLSGSKEADAFSIVEQSILLSRGTGQWNQTLDGLNTLTHLLKLSTWSLRVGE